MSIRKGVSWTFFGFAIWSGCNFLMQVMLGHFLGGGKVPLGIYGTANALTAPLIDLGSFGITSIYVGRVTAKYKLEEYLGLRIVMMAIACVFLAAWTAIEFPGDWPLFWITMVFMGGCICDRTAWIFFSIYQREGTLRYLGISQAVRGGLSLVFFGIGVFAFHSVYVAIIGSAIASLFMIFVWDWPIASRVFRGIAEGAHTNLLIWPSWNWAAYKGLTILSFPIALSFFLDSFALQFPRQNLATLPDGKALVGQLTAYTFAITIGQVGVQAVSSTIAPRMGLSWSSGNMSDFLKVTKISFLLCLVLGTVLPAIAFFVGQPILTTVLNKSFAGDPMTFCIVVVSGSMVFFGTVIGTALTAAKVITFQGIWKIPSAVLTLILTFWLVPKYAVLGAGLVLLIAGLVKVIYGGYKLILAINEAKANPEVMAREVARA